MKGIICLCFLSLAFAASSFGQSACGQLGMPACAPPHPTTPRPTPQPGGRGSQQDEEDNTPSPREAAITAAAEYKQRYELYHNESDFQAAKSGLENALAIKPHDGWALHVLLRLYLLKGENPGLTVEGHKEAYKVAVEARDQADFTSGWDKKYLHKWFTVEADAEYFNYIEAWHTTNCNLHTKPSGGGTVDQSADVMAQLRECQRVAALMANLSPKVDQEIAKFNEMDAKRTAKRNR